MREERSEERRIGGLFRSGDSLNAEGVIGNAPLLDEAAERVIRD